MPPVVCPGCGAVLAPVDEGSPSRHGVSAACERLFEVTLGGLRDDVADPAVAAVVRLADDAYSAQHPAAGDLGSVRAALDRLAKRFRRPAVAAESAHPPPAVWQTTIADVAADLDVVDLPVLVETWARTVVEDWQAVVPTRR